MKIGHRRWFFSEAGRAILGTVAFSASGVLEAAGKKGGSSGSAALIAKPGTASEAVKVLGGRFLEGVNIDRPELNAKILFDDADPTNGHLYAVYFGRLQSRWEELEPADWNKLLAHAGKLGEVTRCMWRFEKADKDKAFSKSGKKHGDQWELKKEHLDWAREAIGFMTNGRIPSDQQTVSCGSGAAQAIRRRRMQTDQPCPLC